MIGSRFHKPFPLKSSHLAPALAFLFSFGVLTFSRPAETQTAPPKPTIIQSRLPEARPLPSPLGFIARRTPVHTKPSVTPTPAEENHSDEVPFIEASLSEY
jgi:hypothetical protein